MESESRITLTEAHRVGKDKTGHQRPQVEQAQK